MQKTKLNINGENNFEFIDIESISIDSYLPVVPLDQIGHGRSMEAFDLIIKTKKGKPFKTRVFFDFDLDIKFTFEGE